MSILVESLKRLYREGRVRKEKIDALKESNKITEEEYQFIMGV